jgi:CDP-diglyceride synthetase
MLVITLISNFGTFMLYMMTCIVAIVAFREHHMFNGFKHFLVPLFGLLANFGCMLFYLVGPFSVAGMSVKEPYIALGFSLVWIIIGAIYLASTSKSRGKEIILTTKPSAA